jgi:hypothetical protein
MEVYITKSEETSQIITHLMPPLLSAVLIDYNNNVEQARDAEVLSSMATIIAKLGVGIINKCLGLFPITKNILYNLARNNK